MDIFEYSNAITQMRDFFQRKKGFIEVPSQARRSMLAAMCRALRLLDERSN